VPVAAWNDHRPSLRQTDRSICQQSAEQRPWPPTRRQHVAGSQPSDVQRIVHSLRRLAAQLAIASPVPPISVIDCLARIDHRDVVVIEQPMNPRMRGGVVRHRGRWLIVLNAADDRCRMRFTLAHELAHVALAVTGCDRHVDERMPSRLREDLCDAFAADLLTPASAMRRAWPRLRRQARPVDATAACFDVSSSVARHRLNQLGLDASGDGAPLPAR